MQEHYGGVGVHVYFLHSNYFIFGHIAKKYNLYKVNWDSTLCTV